jgi:Tannase and feruloyl esterase
MTGAEAGTPIPSLGWEGFILRRGEHGPSGHSILSRGILQDFVRPPFADETTFDYNRDPALLRAAVGYDLDAPPNLRRFFSRGGRLILWHGWADGAISPEATIAYYQAALGASGARAPQSMRLFMAPGLQHCFGGAGPTDFGQFGAPRPDRRPEENVVSAMHAWVETGRAPEVLIGSQGELNTMFGGLAPRRTTPPRRYLLCAYPAEPALRAGGDPGEPEGYQCRAPSHVR